MSYRLEAGGPATRDDLRAAKERDRLLAAELVRVRQVAVAWRNGLGGLLAALVGFSLIKGRSDISQLASPWAWAVGGLLLVALTAGTVGALLLIRAANGPPAVASVRDLLPRSAADHLEAQAAAVALRRGIGLTLTCAAILVVAVAVTWYGPGAGESQLQVATPAGIVCGQPLETSHGVLVLRTQAGTKAVDLSAASAVQPVTNC